MSPPATHQDNPKATHALPTRGKDEMNLAEFPFATLARRDNRDTIVYEGWVVEKGKRHHQKWVVSGSAAVGLPTEFGERVLMALLAVTAEQGFRSKKVTFSVYQLLKIMGLAAVKREYGYVERALKQLTGLTIYSEGAFWDKAKQKRVNTVKAFHLIESLWLRYLENDEEVIEEEGAPGYIVWSEMIWNSIKTGYIKNLDITFFYGLQSSISRRLYRFLDKRMYHQTRYEIDIFELANRLGMARYPKPSHLKRKLQPAFDELVEQAFLASVRVYKKGKYTRVQFVKATIGASRLKQQGEEWTPRIPERERGPERDQWTDRYEELGTMEERETLQALWKQVLDHLKYQLTEATFGLYVVGTVLLACKDREVVIGVPNSYAGSWLEERYRERLLDTVKSLVDRSVTSIKFMMPSDKEEETQ